MKLYSKFKPSGIEWIGDIPEHWELIRLKFLSDITTGDKDTVDREDEGEYPFFVRSQQIERISSYTYDGEAILTAGDGVGVAKVFHYINGKFDFHQRVYKFSEFKKVQGKFLFYYIRENLYKEVLKYNAKSTVDSLRLPFLQNFVIALGNKSEQTDIANFLDLKTGQIDNAIAKKQQLIELLEEERKAIVNEAFGFNSELKNGWQLKRLKYLVLGKLEYGANESAELEDTSMPRYIRITDFGDDGKLKDDTFKSLDTEKAKGYMLSEGDILFARSGATVGKTFQFKDCWLFD